MNDIIYEALKGTGLSAYYLKRPKGKNNCIVYRYKEYSGNKADSKEESIKYDCYFNLFSTENLTEDIEKVKTALDISGFTKIVINSPEQFEGDEYYQTTMNYIKTITF